MGSKTTHGIKKVQGTYFKHKISRMTMVDDLKLTVDTALYSKCFHREVSLPSLI
jgi:hypothetical protein